MKQTGNLVEFRRQIQLWSCVCEKWHGVSEEGISYWRISNHSLPPSQIKKPHFKLGLLCWFRVLVSNWCPIQMLLQMDIIFNQNLGSVFRVISRVKKAFKLEVWPSQWRFCIHPPYYYLKTSLNVEGNRRNKRSASSLCVHRMLAGYEFFFLFVSSADEYR